MKGVAHRTKAVLQFFTVIVVLLPAFALADTKPYDIVKQTADRLVKALNQDPAELKNNPAAYEKIVREHLVPIIDFETIARRVMGRTHYVAANEDQRKRFVEVFQESLVSTYSTGLEIFDNQEIKVLPPNPKEEGEAVQSIDMEVKTSDGTIFPLRFSMSKDEAGQWKVVNVILNGVNVGKAYRNHFAESAIKYSDDINQIIANWSAKIAEDDKSLKDARE